MVKKRQRIFADKTYIQEKAAIEVKTEKEKAMRGEGSYVYSFPHKVGKL